LAWSLRAYSIMLAQLAGGGVGGAQGDHIRDAIGEKGLTTAIEYKQHSDGDEVVLPLDRPYHFACCGEDRWPRGGGVRRPM
jgi:hypothetical protein